MKISFRANGIPVAQPRQRHRIMRSKSGGQFVLNYTPANSPVATWREALGWQAQRFRPFDLLTGPIRLSMTFYFPRPKSHFDSKGLTKRTAPIRKDTKPDLDNLAKAVMDVLTNLGYWRDDAQIASLEVEKWYGEPGVFVLIQQIA